MLEFNETLKKVQLLVKKYGINNNTIEIDFIYEKIYLTDATSHFLKLLYQDNNTCASLHDGKIQIQFFSTQTMNNIK